jgi:hypothetical protein
MPYGPKVQSFSRKSPGTQEDLGETSGRTLGEIQESARKLVDYNQNDLLNPNYLYPQNEFAVSTKDLCNRAIEQKGCGGSIKGNISNSERVVLRKSTEMD